MLARRIVVTGGPGAGKTAILELARRHFCSHVVVVQEAASIVFGGGFPRREDNAAREAAQRAIYHVQVELERLAESPDTHVMLCDRGTLDGLAYWPERPEAFFTDLGTSLEKELARYDVVIHLHTPKRREGYHGTPLRIEHAWEAEAIDARLLDVWKEHPHRIVIESNHDFMTKAKRTLEVIRELLPPECRTP